VLPNPGALPLAQQVPLQQVPVSPLLSPNTPPAPAPPPLASFPISATPPEQLPPNPGALKWDAEVKEYKASPGEANARFTFWLTNVSSAEVLVNDVRTSCGCTLAQLPSKPWKIAPSASGPIEVTVSLAGKSGLIAKGISVDTTAGFKQLTVKVDIPPLPILNAGTMNNDDRMKNMQMALADRQVVFKNQECAKCHADPAKGQTEGRLVYTAVCATCHNSHLRAATVPDLRNLNHPTDAEHWRRWIAYGRAGSMMPAFAESEGGPLNEQQLNALVEFMVKAFPNRAQPPAQRAAVGPAAGLVPASPAPVPVAVQH
jgi:mono/diheme cytochrome c family protein